MLNSGPWSVHHPPQHCLCEVIWINSFSGMHLLSACLLMSKNWDWLVRRTTSPLQSFIDHWRHARRSSIYITIWYLCLDQRWYWHRSIHHVWWFQLQRDLTLFRAELTTLFDMHGLKQHIFDAHRITSLTSSLLDLVICGADSSHFQGCCTTDARRVCSWTGHVACCHQYEESLTSALLQFP